MVVVVLDRDECRLGAAVECDAALTLWATRSEDQYPDLLAKISDFQSQLDEQLRASP